MLLWIVLIHDYVIIFLFFFPLTYVNIGERVDFILVANQSVDSYWIQVRGLGECAETFVQQLAILKYENGPSQPSTPLLNYNDTIDGVVSTLLCISILKIHFENDFIEFYSF